MQKFLDELFYDQTVRKMKMLVDNETSLTLTKNLENKNKIKHINVMYHHIQGLIHNEELGIE